MGFGIRMGAKGAQFKSFLVITSNPSTAVTATFGDITHSGTTDGSGNITFIIKKKGTYSISSATGASATCNINKSNRTFSVMCKWISYISIVANPGETITASGPHFIYTGSTPNSGVCSITVFDSGTYSLSSTDGSSTTGVQCSANGGTTSSTCMWRSYVTVQTNANCSATATGTRTYSGGSQENGVSIITIKKSGTYSITSSSGGSGGNANCTINGENINKDAVFVGTPSCAVGTWSSCTACCYWSWGSYASSMLVYRSNSERYNGGGSWLQLNASQTVLGFSDGNLSPGTYYTYTFRQYYNINNRTFYSSDVNIGYTAYSIGGAESFTYARTYLVPTGVRSIYVQAVGAGGTGSGGSFLEWDNPTYRVASGGGGGGGYIARQSISVIPGQTIYVGVGGGATTATVNGVTVTASRGGDAGGSVIYSQYWQGGNGGAGGSGGSGGSVGGWQDVGWTKTPGGSNGSNGTAGYGSVSWSDKQVPGTGGGGSGADCYINGTLFASGGAGGSASLKNQWHQDSYPGGANTGNGGDGGYACYNLTGGGQSGGTGFCLISW